MFDRGRKNQTDTSAAALRRIARHHAVLKSGGTADLDDLRIREQPDPALVAEADALAQ